MRQRRNRKTGEVLGRVGEGETRRPEFETSTKNKFWIKCWLGKNIMVEEEVKVWG